MTSQFAVQALNAGNILQRKTFLQACLPPSVTMSSALLLCLIPISSCLAHYAS